MALQTPPPPPPQEIPIPAEEEYRYFLELQIAFHTQVTTVLSIQIKHRRANMIPVTTIYLLYLQTVLVIAGPGVTNRKQVSKTFTVNVIFCPSKANSWRSNNISCNRRESKQCTNAWQIIHVSNSTKRHADNSGNHAELTS